MKWWQCLNPWCTNFSILPYEGREMMDAANIGDYLGIYGLCKTAGRLPNDAVTASARLRQSRIFEMLECVGHVIRSDKTRFGKLFS